MIDAKIAAVQLDRLKALDYFPRDNPEALKDLRNALQAAATDVIAIAVVNWWVEHNTDAPKPAELRRLVWDENAKRDRALKEEEEARNIRTGRCPVCNGTGFEIVRGYDRNSGIELTGAKVCRCSQVAVSA